MGKLSKVDSDALIRSYRARAIEVIKELDRLEAGTALSTRDQIEREVKARISLAEQDKPSKRAQNVVDKKVAKAEAKGATPEAKAAAKAAKAAERDDDGDNDSIEAAEKVEAKADTKPSDTVADAKVDEAPVPAEPVSDDDKPKSAEAAT
jgi:hypothetical protein